MLDPARGTLQRVLNDINRTLNAAVANAVLSAKALTTLADLDREAVDAFNAISHHLPNNTQQQIATARNTLEQQWQTQGSFDPRGSHTHTTTMLAAVDARIQAILHPG